MLQLWYELCDWWKVFVRQLVYLWSGSWPLRAHTHTWSGKNSNRNGPRRIMPKLSGSSLVFTRLTLERNRLKDVKDFYIKNRQKEHAHFNPRGFTWSYCTLKNKSTVVIFLCVDVCVCVCACFEKYHGTTKYTSVQTFLRVRSVLLFLCDKKIWPDWPFMAMRGKVRIMPRYREKPVIVSSPDVNK